MIRMLERFHAVIWVAGVSFFLLSFVAMGVAPWTMLKDLAPAPGSSPYTEQEMRGREIYIREACWHCHTQFVRPVANEDLRYGPHSKVAEHVYELPQLYGTRRVGPDLAREAGKRSNDWHLAHFYDPRSVVPWSIMPPFPWLYQENSGKITPSEDAKALVAYMQSIGRNTLADYEKRESAYRASFKVGSPPEQNAGLARRGEELYMRECSGCHGKSGNGESNIRSLLIPPPQDLTTVNPTQEYVFTVLHTGIPGSSMPHFREYADQDLWAITFYLLTLYKDKDYPDDFSLSAETLTLGKNIFDSACSACHDADGRGRGPAASALRPPPPDLHALRPSAGHVYEVLKEGISGTGMVPFTNFSEAERRALSIYVARLARTPFEDNASQAALSGGNR